MSEETQVTQEEKPSVKKERPAYVTDFFAQAVLKNIKASPQKLNLVAAQIRGMHVSRALQVLKFSKKKVAIDAYKTLQSAIANAENNHRMDVDNLYVGEAFVGKNMTLRRFHARARGRGAKVMKHYSQLTIIVEQRDFVEAA